MEQQAMECLQNKDWKKAAELYTELMLTKSFNKDLLLSYLMSRLECFSKMGQHEAVISDCKKIFTILSETKEAFNIAITSSIQSQLVQALFCLERYGEAESTIREWVAYSKSTEASALLEKLHLAMYEVQRKLVLETPKVGPIFSCAYCNVIFNDKDELRFHCQTESHQTTIMSDEGRDWYWRAPPRGMNAESYKQCEYWDEKQNCRFGAQCVDAHGSEELMEWKERYKYRRMKLQRAYDKELFGKSFIDEFLEKYVQSANPSIYMMPKLDFVDDECDSSLSTTVYSKYSVKYWRFTLKSPKPLYAVALLHDVHRDYFKLKQVSLNNIELEIKNNQEYILKTTDENIMAMYQIVIEFNTNIYGTFRQSVVFDFGGVPVLVKNVCVDVLPVEEARKTDEIRQEISLMCQERWTTFNSEIVVFDTIDVTRIHETKTSAIVNMYATPHADSFTLSHSTVNEKRLTANNYRTRMHELLYIEEMARNEQINKHNLQAKLHVVKSYILSSSNFSSSTAKYSNFGELYAYVNLSRDLSEDTLGGRLILNSCTNVLIKFKRETEGENKPKVYEALIEDKGKNVIYLRLSAETVKQLNLFSDGTFDVQLQFQLNRLPYCEWHYAVDQMPNMKIIFPDTYLPPNIPWSPQKQWCDNVDNRLNLKQKEAVIAIAAPLCTPLPPILIIGPFGTGKTFTLAQAIKQLLKQEQSKILICTHSNSAADLYVKDYLDPYVAEGHEEARPLRIYYQRRWVTTVHPVVQQYCLIQESGNVRSFCAPTYEDVAEHRIIVVTLSTSMYLSSLGLPQGYFTHILLDEAAQAIESEAIMPLSLADRHTRIVLAGDHMQLSPELFSRFAKERNLHVSLLERLYDHYPATFPCKILLCENYRAHEAIIQFTSELFYDQKLIGSGNQLSHPLLYPLTFFTARGEDVQDVNSTAFYNSSEAYEIVERVVELKRKWPTSWGAFDEYSIGIMTPYADQVFRIRNELRKRRIGSISVERVLNVQGKQFRVVFLSTVRTRRTCLTSDNAGDENDYGFLSNSKLLNTAITRAQSLVAVVGDPIALCTIGRCSKVWERFLKICDENKSLFGITWPLLKNQLDGLELKKTYGLNPLAPEFVPRMYTTEDYIKLPPARNVCFSQTQPYGRAVSKVSPGTFATGHPVVWPVFRPPPNQIWGFPSTCNRVTADVIPRHISPSSFANLPSCPIPTTRPALDVATQPPNASRGNRSTERDLIQFLDNVHIPAGIKNSHDSLHDLINLLPEDMSLATVLLQPPNFHKQWYHYLMAKKGIDAAKKFEYLITMSTKREKCNDLGKKTIDWDMVYSDIFKRSVVLGGGRDVQQWQQRAPNLNWFDKPVNQINFNKPVYLKDPLHVDGSQHRTSDISYQTNFQSILQYGDNESVRLYERQPAVHDEKLNNK